MIKRKKEREREEGGKFIFMQEKHLLFKMFTGTY